MIGMQMHVVTVSTLDEFVSTLSIGPTNNLDCRSLERYLIVHPEGHKILALVLAYCMIEEEKEMMLNNRDKADIERDFTIDGLLRDPVYLSPEEEAIYVQKETKVSTDIDFTDPNGEVEWKKYALSIDSWTWYADNREEDKFGLISSDMTGGPHVALSVKGGQHGLVEISYVMSYENFGLALAWLDDEITNTRSKECKTADKKKGARTKSRGNKPERLIAYWEETASVPTVQLLKTRLSLGEEKILHICLTPHNEYTTGDENKFKLLGVRVY
jgi:hypothetical protein